MPTCCVPGCGISTGNRKFKKKIKSGVKLSLHRIPKHKTLLKEFVDRIKQETGRCFQISRFTSICSLHYKPDDFHEFAVGRRELKPGSLPSIFDPKSMEKQDQDEQKRLTISFKETGHSSSTDTAETDNYDDELSNDATSCDTPVEFTFDERSCKIEVDPLDISGLENEQDDLKFGEGITTGVIPVTFAYEEAPIKLEMDLLDISGTQSGDESHGEQDDDSDSSKKSDVRAEKSIQSLHRELERLRTLNSWLTEEKRKAAKSNRDFETKFVRISKDLHEARAELQRAKAKTQRYEAERAKLRAELNLPDQQPWNSRNTKLNLVKNVVIYKIIIPKTK